MRYGETVIAVLKLCETVIAVLNLVLFVLLMTLPLMCWDSRCVPPPPPSLNGLNDKNPESGISE